MKTPEEIIENINLCMEKAHAKVVQKFNKSNLSENEINALKEKIKDYQYRLEIGKRNKERIIMGISSFHKAGYEIGLTEYNNGIARFERTLESLKNLLPKEI